MSLQNRGKNARWGNWKFQSLEKTLKLLQVVTSCYKLLQVVQESLERFDTKNGLELVTNLGTVWHFELVTTCNNL